jgi:hypothetical protein
VLTDAAPEQAAAVEEVADPVHVDDGTGPQTNGSSTDDDDEPQGE